MGSIRRSRIRFILRRLQSYYIPPSSRGKVRTTMISISSTNRNSTLLSSGFPRSFAQDRSMLLGLSTLLSRAYCRFGAVSLT